MQQYTPLVGSEKGAVGSEKGLMSKERGLGDVDEEIDIDFSRMDELLEDG